MALALNIVILLPLLAAAAIWSLPKQLERHAKNIALAVGLLGFAVGMLLFVGVPERGFFAETNLPWVEVLNDSGNKARGGMQISYHVALDAISTPLVTLTGLLVPLAVLCSFSSVTKRQKDYYAWLMVLTSAMFGVFAARDVLLFYIFFEFTLVPLYFLIGIWGGPDRRYAANKFFLYTLAGSMLTFAGVMYIAVRAAYLGADAFGIVTLDFGFDAIAAALANNPLSYTEQFWLFIALFAGFAVKVPLFPLHTWLPLAHTEAPTAGSVLLAGVLLKLGTYAFLRISLPMLPEGTQAWLTTMAILAVAGIIYGALISWVQQDIKKLVAYSSVSHLGFCMLGMFSLLPMGLSGSVLYMINHGISTGALFLVVGMLYERYHTRDINALGGLMWKMPVMGFFLLLFTFSSVGLPGTNGFISEFTTLFAAFNSSYLGSPIYGILGATGILLGAIYMLYMAGKVLFGPEKQPENTPDLEAVKTHDLNPREIITLTPLAVLVILLGIAPWLITDKLDTTLTETVLVHYPQPGSLPDAIVQHPLDAPAPQVVSADAAIASPDSLEPVSIFGEARP